MSDSDKMMAFGNWLARRQTQLGAELFSLSVNTKVPVDALRIKAGQLEAVVHVFEAYKDLYNGDINKFMVEYLGQEPEEDKESTTDGST